MAAGIGVDTKRPLRVAKEDGEVTVVKNITSPTIYYKAGQNGESVSSTNNDGSLAKGASLILTQTEFFIATESGAQLEITAYLSPGQSPESPEASTGQVANVNSFGARAAARGLATANIPSGLAKANGEAIQRAIESLGKNGGVVLFPERGTYYFENVSSQTNEAAIYAKESENLILRGQGGLTGGGGVAGKANAAGTHLTYVGESTTVTEVFNLQQTYGFTIERLYIYAASKKLAEKGGIVLNLNGSQFPGGYEFGLEQTGTLVYAGGIGILIGGPNPSNDGNFQRFRISGFSNGIFGKIENTQEAVQHTFINGIFVGQQVAHIKNPDEAWCFIGCTFESLRNEKGEVAGAGAVKIGTGFTQKGLTFIGGWIGGDTAKEETGTQIEFSGQDLNIIGTEMNSAEKILELKGKCKNVLVRAPVRVAKKGLVVAAGAKESTNICWEPSDLTEVTTSYEGEANVNAGSVLVPKEPTVAAWPEIKEPAAEGAEVFNEVKKIAKVLKAAGLAK